MNGHLGDRISALADGQLTPAATERALVHVAGCLRCAGELHAARAARRMVSSTCDVQPDQDLTARLLALGGADERLRPFVPPAGRPAPATSPFASGASPFTPGTSPFASAAGAPSPARTQPVPELGLNGALTGTIGARRRGVRAILGSVTGLGVVAAALFLLGDRPSVTPVARPALALSVAGTGTAAAATTVPVTTAPAVGGATDEYVDWMRANGWTFPTSVPDGWSVAAVRLRDGGSTLEVDATGPHGGLLVTEQHGRLDPTNLTVADQVTVADRTVYLLSASPVHVAWQSGETVVEVVAGADADSVADVIVQFPAGDFDAGLSARIGRGWDTLTAVVDLL